jgi:anti-sigma regulatory factor (Ser/Thr protein kinase)
MGAEGVVRLDVIVTNSRIHVEVRDRGVGFDPAPRVSEDPLDGHWGLELVEKLSDRWHVRGATTVAFELDRQHAA